MEFLKNNIDIIVKVELVEHEDGLRGVSSRTTAKLGTHLVLGTSQVTNIPIGQSSPI